MLCSLNRDVSLVFHICTASSRVSQLWVVRPHLSHSTSNTVGLVEVGRIHSLMSGRLFPQMHAAGRVRAGSCGSASLTVSFFHSLTSAGLPRAAVSSGASE